MFIHHHTPYFCWLCLFASKQQNYIPFWLVKISRDTGKWLGTWNTFVPKMMFFFLPGNHNFEVQFFHIFPFIFVYFPRYFKGEPGKIIEQAMRFPDLCYPLIIKHGDPWESLGWWSLKWSVPAWCLWRPGQTDPIFTKQICRIFTLSTETDPKNQFISFLFIL